MGQHTAPDGGELFSEAALREAYGAWLEGLDWHSFGTFTFRQPRSVRRAGEIFRAFLDAGTARCGEFFAPSVVVWGSEPHKSGDGHIHALLRWHPWCGLRAEAFACSAEWRARYGRVELSKYDPTRGAAYYLTKYVLKDAAGSGEWDVWKEGGKSVQEEGRREVGRRETGGREAGRPEVAAAGTAAPWADPVHDGPPGGDGRPWRSQAEVEEGVDESWWLEEVLREVGGQEEVGA